MPQDIEFQLGQIVAKLDTLISRTNEDRSAVAALDARVKKLEALAWKVAGAATVLGAGAGWLTKVFTS